MAKSWRGAVPADIIPGIRRGCSGRSRLSWGGFHPRGEPVAAAFPREKRRRRRAFAQHPLAKQGVLGQ
jgi:hypothetical protein